MIDSDLAINFPEYKEEILLLVSQDINFREVAEDYIFCKKELEQLSLTQKKHLIKQYEETLEDLKEEIIARIRQIET